MCIRDSCGVLLDADFKPEELGAILEGWDVSNTARRDAALDKQRTEYSSIKNELEFAGEITMAVLEVAQFMAMLAI